MCKQYRSISPVSPPFLTGIYLSGLVLYFGGYLSNNPTILRTCCPLHRLLCSFSLRRAGPWQQTSPTSSCSSPTVSQKGPAPKSYLFGWVLSLGCQLVTSPRFSGRNILHDRANCYVPKPLIPVATWARPEMGSKMGLPVFKMADEQFSHGRTARFGRSVIVAVRLEL